MLFPVFLMLVAFVALSSEAKALQALRRMHLLTRNFWKENGWETVIMPLLWLLLLAGSLSLLLQQNWAKPMLKTTLLLLLGYAIVSCILQIVKLLRLINKGSEAKKSISKFNLEILQKTGLSFFDPQHINSFLRDESNFFTSRIDPQNTDPEDTEKTHLENHIRKHYRKQILAAVINIVLATALTAFAWWMID
jgi:hypothetical protein